MSSKQLNKNQKSYDVQGLHQTQQGVQATMRKINKREVLFAKIKNKNRQDLTKQLLKGRPEMRGGDFRDVQKRPKSQQGGHLRVSRKGSERRMENQVLEAYDLEVKMTTGESEDNFLGKSLEYDSDESHNRMIKELNEFQIVHQNQSDCEDHHSEHAGEACEKSKESEMKKNLQAALKRKTYTSVGKQEERKNLVSGVLNFRSRLKEGMTLLVQNQCQASKKISVNSSEDLVCSESDENCDICHTLLTRVNILSNPLRLKKMMNTDVEIRDDAQWVARVICSRDEENKKAVAEMFKKVDLKELVQNNQIIMDEIINCLIEDRLWEQNKKKLKFTRLSMQGLKKILHDTLLKIDTLLFFKLRDGELTLDQVCARIRAMNNDCHYKVIDDIKDGLDPTCLHLECHRKLLRPFGINSIQEMTTEQIIKPRSLQGYNKRCSRALYNHVKEDKIKIMDQRMKARKHKQEKLEEAKLRGDKLPHKSDNALVQPNFSKHIKLIAQKTIRTLNEQDLNYLQGNFERQRNHDDINEQRQEIIAKIKDIHNQNKNLNMHVKLGCCTFDKIIAQLQYLQRIGLSNNKMILNSQCNKYEISGGSNSHSNRNLYTQPQQNQFQEYQDNQYLENTHITAILQKENSDKTQSQEDFTYDFPPLQEDTQLIERTENSLTQTDEESNVQIQKKLPNQSLGQEERNQIRIQETNKLKIIEEKHNESITFNSPQKIVIGSEKRRSLSKESNQLATKQIQEIQKNEYSEQSLVKLPSQRTQQIADTEYRMSKEKRRQTSTLNQHLQSSSSFNSQAEDDATLKYPANATLLRQKLEESQLSDTNSLTILPNEGSLKKSQNTLQLNNQLSMDSFDKPKLTIVKEDIDPKIVTSKRLLDNSKMEEILQELFCTAEIQESSKDIKKIISSLPYEHQEQLNHFARGQGFTSLEELMLMHKLFIEDQESKTGVLHNTFKHENKFAQQQDELHGMISIKPKVVFTGSKSNINQDLDTCEICKMALSRASTLPCQHTFCLGCVKTALLASRCCPTCQKKVPNDFKPKLDNSIPLVPEYLDLHHDQSEPSYKKNNAEFHQNVSGALVIGPKSLSRCTSQESYNTFHKNQRLESEWGSLQLGTKSAKDLIKTFSMQNLGDQTQSTLRTLRNGKSYKQSHVQNSTRQSGRPSSAVAYGTNPQKQSQRANSGMATTFSHGFKNDNKEDIANKGQGTKTELHEDGVILKAKNPKSFIMNLGRAQHPNPQRSRNQIRAKSQSSVRVKLSKQFQNSSNTKSFVRNQAFAASRTKHTDQSFGNQIPDSFDSSYAFIPNPFQVLNQNQKTQAPLSVENEGQKTPEERVAKLHQRLLTEQNHMNVIKGPQGLQQFKNQSGNNSQPNFLAAHLTHSSSDSKMPKSPDLAQKDAKKQSTKATSSLKPMNPILAENTHMTKYLNASLSKENNIFLDIHRPSKDKQIPQKQHQKQKKNSNVRTSINLKQTFDSGNNQAQSKSNETLDSIQSLQVTKIQFSKFHQSGSQKQGVKNFQNTTQNGTGFGGFNLFDNFEIQQMLMNNRNLGLNTDIQIRDYSKKFYYGGDKEWHHDILQPIQNTSFEMSQESKNMMFTSMPIKGSADYNQGVQVLKSEVNPYCTRRLTDFLAMNQIPVQKNEISQNIPMKNKYTSQMPSQRISNKNNRYKEEGLSKADVGIEAFQSIDDDQYNDNTYNQGQDQDNSLLNTPIPVIESITKSSMDRSGKNYNSSKIFEHEYQQMKQSQIIAESFDVQVNPQI